jgi:hypothetical protein
MIDVSGEAFVDLARKAAAAYARQQPRRPARTRGSILGGHALIDRELSVLACTYRCSIGVHPYHHPPRVMARDQPTRNHELSQAIRNG